MSLQKRISQVSFLTSAAKVTQLPTDEGKEVVFAGRSNAGKSSVLNVLTRQKSLARTSKTPGRTQLMNVFSLDEEHRLIDLPGYGFAKVPEAVRLRWQKTLANYFATRKSLVGIVLIMDVRHPLRQHDIMMLDWAEHNQIPTHILLNKADKISFGAAKTTLLQLQQQLCPSYQRYSLQLFSSLKRTGINDCLTVLSDWLDS